MPLVLTGTYTTTKTVAPHLTSTVVNTLLATAVENLTLANLELLDDLKSRLPDGDRTATLKSLL